MKNLKEILQKLEDFNMCVHEIDHSAGYRDFCRPLAHMVMSSHYIIKGDDIVFVGNLKMLEGFVHSLGK